MLACANRHIGIRTDMCIVLGAIKDETSLAVQACATDMCVDVLRHVCVDACVDVCADVHRNMCRRVCRHVYRRV